MYNEPISTGPGTGEGLDRDKYEVMLNQYYQLRGWDEKTGIPGVDRMQKLGLEKEIEAVLSVVAGES